MESAKRDLHTFALKTIAARDHAERTEEFVRGLMACFGWEEPPGDMGAELTLDGGEVHKSGLWWPERKILIEVRKPYVMLKMAWEELLRAILAMRPMPRYVLFTNRRELYLYDTKEASRSEPALAIDLEDLPRYSENLRMLSADWQPAQGIGKVINVSQISQDVARRVGTFYRSLIQGEVAQDDAVRFTLQCITAMFAEDIGLLPKNALTQRLWDAQAGRAGVAAALGELFGQMASPQPSGVHREVRYFNGGLFCEPVVLDLNEAQLRALTKAAESNWEHVDPHIFGSVFEGIMGEAERHATGAHYTAREDIMLVVGPTIVEPWRRRIESAQSLNELKELREELGAFRVLDPACGSGNFLYVAYRELYRLESELLGRMHAEYPSVRGKIGWGTAIRTTSFYGIDINPFAVELARTTLNIAKKIAFEERQLLIRDVYEQVEIQTDPSLPLDNLNQNILCADALFTPWPEADAIVGNPPFLGHSKIRAELGSEYVSKLSEGFNVGIVDLCAYWFILSHNALKPGSRSGLIATSGIRIGRARAVSLEYITKNNGEILNAVSSMAWGGEATVNVSIINWIKGSTDLPKALFIKGKMYNLDEIHPHLRLMQDTSLAKQIKINGSKVSEGMKFANKLFYLPEKLEILCSNSVAASYAASGQSLLSDNLEKSKKFVDFKFFESEEEARLASPDLFRYLEENLKPIIEKRARKEQDDQDSGKKSVSSYRNWLKAWWLPYRASLRFFKKELNDESRIIVCASVAARPIFCFISVKFVPTNTMHMFAFDDDYSFGIIQSLYHWEWTMALGGRLKNDIRYTTKVWKTFPWPQAPDEEQAVRIAQAARGVRAARDEVMQANGWSLRQLYQAAEEAGVEHPLNLAQAELDEAVGAAYGHPEDQGIVEFLLELNGYLAEDEREGLHVQGPGIPAHLDAHDPRFMSTDCITPPTLEP